jgi:hypothetical protein
MSFMCHERSRSIIACLALLPTAFLAGVTPVLAGPLPPHVRVVALSGRQAPGTPAGTTFFFLTPSAFDGAPAIGPDSTIGFAGTLSDGTAGFWLDRGSGPSLLSQSGTHAPGTDPGVVFSQRISEAIIFSPPRLARGHALLFNTITGPGVDFINNQGLWNLADNGLDLVVRSDQPAPGIAGARLGAINVRALDAAGRAVFSTALAGVLTGFNDQSIWRASPDGALELLEREGDAAPGAGLGVVFANPVSPFAFPIIIANGAGDVLFQGNLHGPGADVSNDEALFIRDAAGARLLVREGDPVPGMPGFVFRAGATAGFNTDDFSINDDSRIAMVATVESATGIASALLADLGNGLELIARSGDPAPGADEHFGIFTSPVMNTRGDIAFLANFGQGTNLGLWVYSQGALRAVAIPDQPVPGLLDGDRYFEVQAINGFNDSGALLFKSSILSPLGAAMVLSDASGNTAVLARILSDITIDGNDRRSVREIVARRGALSDDSRATFGVRFSDGSDAIIEAGLADPAPCGADVNRDGTLTSQDFFDFLPLFFAGEPAADFNASGVVDSQDFFDFLAAFFAGC